MFDSLNEKIRRSEGSQKQRRPGCSHVGSDNSSGIVAIDPCGNPKLAPREGGCGCYRAAGDGRSLGPARVPGRRGHRFDVLRRPRSRIIRRVAGPGESFLPCCSGRPGACTAGRKEQLPRLRSNRSNRVTFC